MKMKILLATSAAIPSGGGIAAYNQELCNLLGKEHELFLLTDSNECNVEGYKKTYSNYGKPHFNFEFCRKLVDKINAAQYDLIINSRHSIMPYIVPFLNAPIVSVAHFVRGIQADNAGYNSDYLSSIIALSYYSKSYLDREFKILDKQKVKVVYNFVANNPKEYATIKEKAQELTIVYPGGTSVQKSVDVVLDTVYRLKASNLKFKFIWLGGTVLPSSKMSILGLRNTTQLIKDDERIILTGKVSREKSIEYISSANVFLLPSRGEGCPMTLLEAMREGCIPIVSSAHHGSRELLEKSGCGIIVKQGESKELYEKLKDIIENHSEYLFNYQKTYNFSQSDLSEAEWGRKMAEIISEAILSPKKVHPMTYNAFKKSLTGFKRRICKERIKTILLSAWIRIKIDYIYLKWKGRGVI